MIRIKRVYEDPKKSDGTRVLVDRVWPRGLSKEKAGLDQWLKEIAPSAGLRKWFGHDPVKWTEFKRKYFTELDEKEDLVHWLLVKSKEGHLTLLYAAKDEKNNNAAALKEYLERNSS
jgi:uncharacterized protein YeaO (DUF488 family)